MPGILVYSAGSRGIGQTMRAIKIGQLAQRGLEQRPVTVVCCQIPPLNSLNSDVQVLHPPSLTRMADAMRADDRGLARSLGAQTALDLIHIAEEQQPDIFVSLTLGGLTGELETVFRSDVVRQSRRVLALRDIYSPVTREFDYERGMQKYDRVSVFAPAATAHWIPEPVRRRVTEGRAGYYGYLPPLGTFGTRQPPGWSVSTVTIDTESHSTLEVSVGGGYDGAATIDAAMQAIQRLRQRTGWELSVKIVLGPLMGTEEAAALRRALPADTDIVRWRPQRKRPADLVVTMAGYNTLSECAWHGTRTVCLPRVDRTDREQDIRGRLFARWFPQIRTVDRKDLVALERALSNALSSDLGQGNRRIQDYFATPALVGSALAT